MTTQEKAIFYPKTWLRVLVLLSAFGITGLYISLSQTQQWSSISIWSVGVVSILLLIFAFIFALKTSLTVDSEGLRVEGIFAASAKWEQVSHFGWKHSLWWSQPFWGIYYYTNPKSAKPRRKFLSLSHIVDRPAEQKVEMLVVLVGVDWEKFIKTEFGQILYEYAPQLFEQEPSTKN